MTSAESRPQPDSGWLPGLDLYRAVVVLMMFVVHARRVQDPLTGGTTLDELIDACMQVEPYIAASFLFIAGVSLVLSHERAGGKSWLMRMLRRALGLYALAVVLFVMQFGLDLPDLLASPGILSAIGVAIACVALCLSAPRSNLVLTGAAVVSLSMSWLLERSGIGVSGINAGPGGAFPLVTFALFGALTWREYRKRGCRSLLLIAMLGLLPFAALLVLDGAWTTTHVSHYTDLRGQTALALLLERGAFEGPRVPVGFWNHSTLGALALTFPLSLSLFVALALPRELSRARGARPFLTLGRHALAAYVLHLLLLGVVELVGGAPVNAAQTWILVFVLALLAYSLARALDRHRRRRALPTSERDARAKETTS